MIADRVIVNVIVNIILSIQTDDDGDLFFLKLVVNLFLHLLKFLSDLVIPFKLLNCTIP